jgi:hypothetical protein
VYYILLGFVLTRPLIILAIFVVVISLTTLFVITLDLHVVLIVTSLPILAFNISRTQGDVAISLVQIERVKVVKCIFTSVRFPRSAITAT